MGRIKPEEIPFKISDQGFYLDGRLTALVDGSAYDFMGREIFSVGFFRENIGFGIMSVDIELNTNLHPIITITFKDLYGNTMFGKTRTSVQPTATFENLMKEYKSFIGEAEEEETDEGIMDKAKAFGKKVLDKVGHGDDEDMIKDLQKKAGVPQTGKKPEPANESMADILKLSGLK
jgi:hypothetical protein